VFRHVPFANSRQANNVGRRDFQMKLNVRSLLAGTVLGAASVLAWTGGASANADLLKLEQNPADWVMPTGDYANHRYSALNQINAQNVKNLHPVWTFSTGVLRGHEGAPLVIGDVRILTSSR
jgi:glucose dehydrogenase